jgi:LacI family transcriptional regulator
MRGDRWPVDGVVLRDAPEYAPMLLARGRGVRTPLVSMGLAFTTQVDHVGIDIYGAAVEAIEHLIALGRKRVAYVVPQEWNTPTNPRRKAYGETMRRFRLKREVVLTDFAEYIDMRRSAREQVRDYVAAHGCPGAFFCYNDETAIGVQRGMFDLGLRVPEDAALVGCDGIDETEFHQPALSTITLPQEEMCRLAWQFLQRRIEEPNAPRQAAILKPRLVVRESSRFKRVLCV